MTYTIHTIPEPHTRTDPERPCSYSDAPILLDIGANTTRIGYTSTSYQPTHVFPTQVAKHRDRKFGRTFTLVGNDIELDAAIKPSARSPFDGPFIANWELYEKLLDYSFHMLGVSQQITQPLIMTEVPGQSKVHRQMLYELLFEAYQAPSVAMGIDSLYSYYYNGGNTGIVVDSSYEATHILPVIHGKGIMSNVKRLNIGGRLSTDYLGNLLGLKYPFLPNKLSQTQVNWALQNFCYISPSYQEELKNYLELNNLEKKDITMEMQFNITTHQKTEEEIARQEARKKESAKRLQEQAVKTRLTKLVQKEHDWEYFKLVQENIENANKKDVKKLLDAEGFEDLKDFNKYISNLDRSIKRARRQDIGTDESNEPPSFALVEIPDDQLDELQLKEKKKQRLLKASYDARQRAKREKELQKEQLKKDQLIDEEFRKNDLDQWISTKRNKLNELLKRERDRKNLKRDLSKRKSHAAQLRMKSIANLASSSPTSSNSTINKKRRTIDDDPNDTFGANDDDWLIYRDIANPNNSEQEEEELNEITKLEQQLLEFDPNFTFEDTRAAQYDFIKSVIHKFLRGPKEANLEDLHQQHQVHLNIERIRVPEILFQPSIVGVDQAGIVEIMGDFLLRKGHFDWSTTPYQTASFGTEHEVVNLELAKDIFITGGQASFKNFEQRLQAELTAILPVSTPINIRKASNPLLDAWKGMAKWSTDDRYVNAYVTRQEWDEMGSGYIKEHGLGNWNL